MIWYVDEANFSGLVNDSNATISVLFENGQDLNLIRNVSHPKKLFKFNHLREPNSVSKGVFELNYKGDFLDSVES